jgi:hypothetical protein
MKKFPQDDQAKTICKNWAEDFKTMGMIEDYMFWEVTGLGFEIGGTVHDSSIIARIDRTIQSKIAVSKMTAIFPSPVKKALLQIGHEAKYLHKILTQKRD